MTFDLIAADPAGNITVFVLNPVPASGRAALANKLLSDPGLKAEQVGFAVPPLPDTAPEGTRVLGRLEMMGGEFCGNAARSFGLYCALQAGLEGRRRLFIECSGAYKPVPVLAGIAGGGLWSGFAEAEIPPPLSLETIHFAGQMLPVCVFPGITHIIAPEIIPSKENFFALKEVAETALKPEAAWPPDALGVLFLPRENAAPQTPLSMTPAVYVYATGSLVFESSCGSGSAALAVWKSWELFEGEAYCQVRQPGGIIEARVIKRGGRVETAAIGGLVTLRRLTWVSP